MVPNAARSTSRAPSGSRSAPGRIVEGAGDSFSVGIAAWRWRASASPCSGPPSIHAASRRPLSAAPGAARCPGTRRQPSRVKRRATISPSASAGATAQRDTIATPKSCGRAPLHSVGEPSFRQGRQFASSPPAGSPPTISGRSRPATSSAPQPWSRPRPGLVVWPPSVGPFRTARS